MPFDVVWLYISPHSFYNGGQQYGVRQASIYRAESFQRTVYGDTVKPFRHYFIKSAQQ